MNIFGAEAADGSGKFLNRIVFAGFVLAGVAIASVVYLDHAGRNGSLATFWPAGDVERRLQNLPQSQEAGRIGVRYGNVDYMPTASIPASRQTVKNVVSDPSLGMPQ